MIVFDLDKTLFNAWLLKDDCLGVLADFGVTEQAANKQVDADYEFIDTSLGDYSIIKHIKILENILDAQKKEIKEIVLNIIKERGAGYLFPHALEVIKYAKSKSKDVVLVTRGDLEWQNAKVIASGLGDIFTDYHYVEGNKVKLLDDLSKTEKVLSINDKAQEINDSEKIENISNIFVNLLNIQKPDDSRIPEIKSLKELPATIDRML